MENQNMRHKTRKNKTQDTTRHRYKDMNHKPKTKNQIQGQTQTGVMTAKGEISLAKDSNIAINNNNSKK